MQVTKNITLDLLETGSPVIIKAKQNDRNTRYIAAHLYVDGLAYPVPSGTEIAFRYKKPDGTAGFYDTLPDNSPAITVSGNTVTVELVEQVLTEAGCVHCEINMYNAASEKLTTFTFEISVEESVLTDAEITSSDYYNVLTAEIAKALQAVTDATEQAENAAQSAQDAADSAAMSKDWAAGQPVTYSGTPVSIAYAGAQRIASITAYGETPQGGTTEAPVALTGVDSAILFEQHTPINLAKPNEGESNGISIIANADGSVTARGTATKDTWPVLVRINIPSSIVSGDITISLSSPASVGMAFQSHSPSGKVENVYLSAGYTSVTTKIKSGYTGMHIFLSLLPDQTIDETFHIMIAQGIEPVPFVPYVEPSVTTLPIPRPLHKVGDVMDVCRTRVKSVYDKRIVLDVTEDWRKRTDIIITGGSCFYPNNFIADAISNAPIAVSAYFVGRTNSTTKLWEARQVGSNVGIQFNAPFTEVSDFKAWLAAHPLTVYYQSTAYDGTNGLDVMESTYNVGYIESYADESITTAWISSMGALSTGAEVAYVLSSPETYATDPVDFDNAAGPLTVMTGGEVEVRMTDLIGSRSDVSNNTVAFSEASQDADIQTGEKLSVLFGKIKKRFSNIYNKTESDERYATATQGGKADNALPKTGGIISGNLTVVQDLTVQRAFNGMRIKAGTKTITTPTTSARAELFNSDTLNELFGTTGVAYTNANCVVIASNGDYDFHPRVVTSGYVNSKWAVFTADAGNFTIGTMRVNYIAIKFA